MAQRSETCEAFGLVAACLENRAALGPWPSQFLCRPGKMFKAIRQLETAAKMNPELTDARYTLALALAQIPSRLPLSSSKHY